MLSRANSCLQKFERMDKQQYHDEGIRTCQSEAMNESCSSSSSSFGGIEESEVVEELLQILVACVRKTDIKGQEILLRKFFSEIEKEEQLERFLVARLKQSRISSLIDQRLFLSEVEAEISTRELRGGEAETSEKEKMDRFKIKTLQVGVDVKEEKAG